jgi:hypothetical protein
MVLQVLLGHKVFQEHLPDRVLQAQLGRLVALAQLAQLGRLVVLAQLAQLDSTDQQVLLGRKAQQVLVLQVHKVLVDSREQVDLLDL